MLYNSYASYLDKKYGYRLYRVGVDANFSCPNRDLNKHGGCLYCDALGAVSAYQRKNESSYTRKSAFETDIDLKTNLSVPSIEDQVARGMDFLKRRYHAEHFALYLQSFSNTYAPLEKLKEIYSKCLMLFNWEAFIVSTRPDCLEEEKLDYLASLKTPSLDVSLEIGLQSASDDILKAMNRGHDVLTAYDAIDRAQKKGLDVCVHILLGFPGETMSDVLQTAKFVAKVHPHAVKIHNLNIVAGTPLFNLFEKGLAKAPSAEEYLEKLICFLRNIPSDIIIERLMCETPSHRLADPRNFPDKNSFLKMLKERMENMHVCQGDLV